MFKHHYKKLICLFFVVVLSFVFSPSAFAVDPLTMTGIGGVLGGALGATGVTGTFTGSYDAYNSYFNSQVSDPYSWTNDISSDGFVKKRDSVQTIDDVSYDEIWFSHEFAEYLQSEGFSYIIDNSIQPNIDTSTRIVDGVATFAGIPIYSGGHSARYNTPSNSISSVGDVIIYNSPTLLDAIYPGNSSESVPNGYGWDVSGVVGRTGPQSSRMVSFELVYSAATAGNYTSYQIKYRPSNYSYDRYSSTYTHAIDNNDFSFDYVSSVIDADVLPDDQGLSLLVPSSYFSSVSDAIPAGIYDNSWNESEGIGDREIINSIINVINQAGYDGEVKNSIWASEPSDEPVPSPTPAPTVAPVGDTPLGEVPYQDWFDTFGQSLNNNFDGVKDIIGLGIDRILDSFSSLSDIVGQKVDAVRDAVSSIPSSIGSLKDSVVSGFANIYSYLEGITTAILEDIEQGPIKLFDGALDALKSFSAPVLATLKSFLGIWHYVVEWVQSIAGVFSWIFGILSSSSYYFVLPIYAGIAGFIVIKIYKVFGR